VARGPRGLHRRARPLLGEWISYGDFRAIATSSLAAFGLCYWLVYLPVLRVLRRVLPLQAPAWPFAVVAVLIGVLPTALIARYWSGSFRTLMTPEASLFLVLFTAVGLTVGFGFPRIQTGR